jgi:GntR family transcriptional regulator
MLLNLSDMSDESLQNQIVRQIRAMVLGGELAAGDPLPSIRALAREQRVSVITVQRAYETLDRNGLIHSRRGKGFFVSSLPATARRDMARERLRENLAGPLRTALAEGLTPGEIRAAVDKLVERLENTEEGPPPAVDVSAGGREGGES